MDIAFDIAIGLLRLIVLVSAGVFAGSLLESTGWTRKLGFLVRPLTNWAKLPSACGSAFVTAFVSPRAANSMLAGAYADNKLRRHEMITGALINIFPNTLCHMRVLAFAVIPLLGVVGAAYVGFQFVTALVVTVIMLGVGRGLSGKLVPSGGDTTNDTENREQETETWGEATKRAMKRTRKILTRVMLITAPLYIAVGILDHLGIFRQAAEVMPQALAAVLPPASVTVVAGHMSSVMNAAGIGAELMHSGTLSGYHLLMTLIAGNLLSMPIRAMRHTIPSILGIFPPRDGIMIVVVGQILRAAIGLSIFIGLWVYFI